jgi:hypothetical protein
LYTRSAQTTFYTVRLNVPYAVQAGPGGGRALTLSSPVGLAELIASPDTGLNAKLLAAVTAKLGDVTLGPPSALPADILRADGQ